MLLGYNAGYSVALEFHNIYKNLGFNSLLRKYKPGLRMPDKNFECFKIKI